jgi:hypothetical protein
MNGRIGNFIDQIFRLYFDDDGGGGGGLGDVSDVAHGHSGDVSILERGAEDEEDDADDADDDEDSGRESEDDGIETFEEPDETPEEGEEETDDKDKDKDSKDDEDKEVFEGRPTLTDLKKTYPGIFKKYPELREVLFREQELSKHFGTVEEAADAASKASNFDLLEAGLLAGDPSLIIQQLGENAPEAVAKLADNFLPKLLAHSQDLYLRATVPVIEQFMFTAYEHGKASGDANLMKSMQHAAKFFFGKPDIPDPRRRMGEGGPHPAEKRLEEERKNWQQTRFTEASGEVSSAIDSELEVDILKGLDPDKKLSERQRQSLITEIKSEIDAQLGKDEAFKRQMKALWSRAAAADYPRDQRASIKSAFLARAKALVPSVRTRLRAEWFGEKDANSGKPSDKNKQGQQSKKRTLPDSGRAAGGGPKRPPSAKEVDFTKTSDLDLIEGRYARRK